MLHCVFRVEPGDSPPDLASLEWLANQARVRPAGPPHDPTSRWSLI